MYGELSMEEMMKQAKDKGKGGANLDSELDDMIANDPELKGLSRKKKDSNYKHFYLFI